MDTQRLAEATRFHHLAITITYDPGADDSERWIVCIGFDCFGAGSTADEAFNAAINREALGPESEPTPEELPFSDEPAKELEEVDDGPEGYWYAGTRWSC